MVAEPRRRAYQLEDDILGHLTALGPSTGYDMVRGLRGSERRISPAMVYRSLSRLIVAGRVMRVELLKAFMVAPTAPSIALICSACGSVAILPCPAMIESLCRDARARRFTIDRLAVELLGLCSRCRSAGNMEAHRDGDRGTDPASALRVLDTV